MIASRWQIRKNRKEQRRKRASDMGKASAKSYAEKIEGREIGPRRTPPCKLRKTVMIADPTTGEVNRYDVFKSHSGKRKIDIWINRDTSREQWIRGTSATWFARKFLSHLAMLAEIEED